MHPDRFKDLAWGTAKGRRVFTQMAPFGVHGQYDLDGHPDDDDEVTIRFDSDDAAGMLQMYVGDLLEYSEDDGTALERFRKADMSLYQLD